MEIQLVVMVAVMGVVAAGIASGQMYDEPDRSAPGDGMIQAYLRAETEKVEARVFEDVGSAEDWAGVRTRLKDEYFYMLGLSPLPERTALEAKVTGSLEGDGFVVDMVTYQSRPHLYVTGNLYRPKTVKAGERLPAVFYVCGHSVRGRNGNKTAYQAHGMWFARHGYICLMVDSLQLGEIGAIHHGTYRENRWWWHSRGYTPAGVECWNGVRGIDYLLSRPDVDPERIAVTGISGGGAATYWISAADERVKVAVPVSGMADLMSYVPNRTINGHCDCMFLYNAFEWPWTWIAGLIAPRPMLFVNSDQDPIFPMDANERIINRLERLYSRFGAGDLVDAVVSVGGHAYRKDIRQAAYRFINMHLKDDPRIVQDSEVDLVAEVEENPAHPIAPEKLRVFPEDADIPKDELNTTIDRLFVPMAELKVPGPGELDAWRKGLLAELRRVSFRYFPERVAEAKPLEQPAAGASDIRLGSEAHIEFHVRPATPGASAQPKRVVLAVLNPDEAGSTPAWLATVAQPDDTVYLCEVRGIGQTRWTRKNPPNYVERSHALLGRTVDTGRVWDVAAAARYLRAQAPAGAPIHVVGKGFGGVLGAYAALFEPDIAGVTLIEPPLTHMDDAAPQFLNVLRVCDIPDVLGALAPRPVTIRGGQGDAAAKIAAIYKAAGAASGITLE